jgi:hypothetical protein
VPLASNDARSVGLIAASGDMHGVPIATKGERSGVIRDYRRNAMTRISQKEPQR